MEKVLVIGAKRSGIYAALLAQKMGFKPFVSESSGGADFERFTTLLENNSIPYELNGHSFTRIKEFDFAILSPGVPLDAKIISEIKNVGIPFMGEMEFAYRSSPKTNIVAITGTNGKSTTTALTGNIFSFSGLNVVTGGNLGTPYSELLFRNPLPEVAVLETSCFQLETIVNFHPRVSVFLNFTEDHLNRYKNMEEYLFYKKRIFENQTDTDFAVLNYDNIVVRNIGKNIRSQVYFFSINEPVDRGVFIKDNQIVFNNDGEEEVILPVSSIRLRGLHNLENVLAAVTASKLMNLPNVVIKEGAKTFKGLEHRLEEVRKINGVLYINDSKATTPDSTIKAINSFDGNVILIAGGSSKNNDFSNLAKVLHKKVKKLILLGDTAPDIANSALEAGYSDIVFASDLKEAVLIANKISHSGDIVLLSPACASFDMFRDFEDRGRQFKEIVETL